MVKDVKEGVAAGCLVGIFFDNLRLDSNITYKIRLPATLRTSGAGYVADDYSRSCTDPLFPSSRGIFSGDRDWRTNLLYPVFPVIGPRYPKKLTGGSPSEFFTSSLVQSF